MPDAAKQPAKQSAKRDGQATKALILKAANSLFYQEGIRATGVDAIAEKAGVTKRTLYYHFRSKDDLIEAYLLARDIPNLQAFQKWFDQGSGSLEAQVAAMFQGMCEATDHPKWRGCGFLRTAGELANMPGHPAIKAASSHKKHLEGWLSETFRREGLQGAASLARQLVLLIDGAFSSMAVHQDRSYFTQASEAACTLVRLARGA